LGIYDPNCGRQREALVLLYNGLRADLYPPEGQEPRMSDRGVVFLFSLFMIVASLGAVVWLLVTGQAGTVDGLFLVLTALLTAAVFALYLKFTIGRAMEAQKQAVAPPAKAAAPAKPAAATTVAQS